MEKFREYTEKPKALGLIGLVVGIFIGLVVLGWWLWPVKWIDASPQELSAAEKESYLRMAVEAYGYNGDISKAVARYDALGEEGKQILANITAMPMELDLNLLNAFSSSVLAAEQMPVTAVEPAAAVEEAPAVEETQVELEPAKEGPSAFVVILIILVIGLALGALYYFFLRERLPELLKPREKARVDDLQQQAAYDDYAASDLTPPVAQFMASYTFGDDLFDDSFSIDSSSGEFLGECGVGISETIGVGEPKKVTAFEVWLFDKNDIQTVTTVLMSENAFQDLGIRQRLQLKGELTQAQEGGEVVLDTQTLQLVARVVNMEYGDGAMPAQSYFKNFLIELAVWPKQNI